MADKKSIDKRLAELTADGAKRAANRGEISPALAKKFADVAKKTK